ncbi:MAG: hypothetical protein JNL78_09505 [Rhodocyclaceae bacterium]|nr:hypothetical protein [Rhodocyclaceae bacterium]
MQIGLKIAAFFFGFIVFLGFGWWDRSDLSLLESAYWLSPAFSLLLIAVIPFRLLSANEIAKWGISALVTIGVIRLVQGMIASWNSPIEPDTPAILLRLVMLSILASSIYLIWTQCGKPRTDPE